MRVISFKSRHPIINNENEREEESIVDNYDQFQRREKERKKKSAANFYHRIIRRSWFVGLNKIHKKSDRVRDRLKPQVSTGIKIRERHAYKSAISRDRCAR